MIDPSQNLSQIQANLLSGEITMLQLVQAYLDNISSHHHLNAFIEVFTDEALSKAGELDLKIKTNPSDLGSLFGCVISIKDLICYRDHKVSAASKILEGFNSQISATAVEAVISADAIIIGRTNCDEFGMGSTNMNSAFGYVSNGIDSAYIPGGSSGGSAVSVQMNMCHIALGTDTGGSVRQPAAFCGLYGFKPSYGMVSRFGLVAYASSFDQIGILAHHPNDIDRLMNVISCQDEFDSTMFKNGLYREGNVDRPTDKYRIAVLGSAINHSAVDPGVRSMIYQRIDDWKSQGHTIESIEFDFLDYLIPCYYILTTAEASSNLSRYDGVRYGYRSSKPGNINEMYVNTRSEGFGSEVKKRIMLGNFVLSEAYYDAYFTKAQQVRALISQAFEQIFENYDFVALPTTATTPWRHDDQVDPLAMYMSDIYTVIANLAGLPAANLPIGLHENGLPVGIQLMANRKMDQALIDFIL